MLRPRFNTVRFNESQFNEAAAATAAESVSRWGLNYLLEVCAPDGSVYARLPRVVEGTWTQYANRPNTLEFVNPMPDEYLVDEYLAFPNTIKIRDRDGVIVDNLIIRQVTKARGERWDREVTVYCEDFQSLLDFSIDSYAATNKRVSEIVGDLLALQNGHQLWDVSYYDIAAAVGDERRTVNINNRTILAVLQDLQASVGGYYWVDERARFHWKVYAGTYLPGQRIRLNKNIVDISKEIDYTQVATRVVAYGHGPNPDDRMSATVLTEDADALATYGTVTHAISNPSMTSGTDLQLWAQEYLARHASPRSVVQVDAIELAMADTGTWDYAHDRFILGSRIRLIDEDLDINILVQITEVERDLLHPLNTRVVVSDPLSGSGAGNQAESGVKKDVLDTIVDIVDLQNHVVLGDPGFDTFDFDPEDLPETLVYDGELTDALQDLEDKLEGSITSIVVPTVGTNIQPVGGSNDPGTNTMTFAADDHVHAGTGGTGMAFATGYLKENLPNFGTGEGQVVPPILGYTTAPPGYGGKRYYMLVPSGASANWICFSHLEDPDE